MVVTGIKLLTKHPLFDLKDEVVYGMNYMNELRRRKTKINLHSSLIQFLVTGLGVRTELITNKRRSL